MEETAFSRAQRDFSQYMKDFTQESDRGCAVLMMCVLEEALIDAIRSKLPVCSSEELRNFAPPGRLSATIVNAYLLGILSDKERSDIQILSKVRNKFAHAALNNLSFNHHDIKFMCEKLHLSDFFSEFKSEIPRHRFLISSFLMYFMLKDQAHDKSKRLKIKEDTPFCLKGL
jgi:hypothetical protein